MNDEPLPLLWKRTLAEVFAEAEEKGLGTFSPSFQAAPGGEDQAATFIGARCEHLSNLWPDEIDVQVRKIR